VDDAGDVLQAAGDPQRGLLRDDQTVALKDRRDDDGVGDAGLVLETHKHKALR